ncbi:MAG: hypothetical protein SF051_16600 [Elusimicrobiota bacterium]|nr:hypothetical protein [Elusimicrobiota bacterium]
MSLDAGSLLAGLVFSGLGFVAFRYGRTTGNFRLMALGGALMVYPYFTPTPLSTWGVGVVLSAAAWYARHDD